MSSEGPPPPEGRGFDSRLKPTEGGAAPPKPTFRDEEVPVVLDLGI